MDTTTITEVATLREIFGEEGKPDRLNMLLITEAGAFNDDAEEQRFLDHATKLQVEGWVLHPRKLIAREVQIVTDDADDADYVLRLVAASQATLAARQAEALTLGAFADTGMFRLGGALARG